VQKPEGNLSFDSPYTFQPVVYRQLLHRLACNAAAVMDVIQILIPSLIYRGADKSLARPGRKQDTATEDFDVHISYL
jgi:hypothetical protein